MINPILTMFLLAAVWHCNARLLMDRDFRASIDDNSLDSQIAMRPSSMVPMERLEITEKKRESNKKLIRNFYQEVFGDKNVNAIDKYISEEIYIQHNPAVADGRKAFKEAATQWFTDAPKETVNIQRISADGDLVWVHTKTMNEGKLTSCIDIFRIHHGKIFEHWDVMQEVPEMAANSHPMF